jgi:ABC-type nitrate/sulfonate/bicarbonate transport system permease component
MSVTQPPVTAQLDAPPVRRWYRRLPYEPLLSVAAVILLLVGWQIVVTAGLLDRRLWPSTTDIMGEIGVMFGAGELQIHIWATVQRLFWAFTFGALAGVTLGLLMGMFRPVRAVFDPFLSALSVLPKIAILPLVYLAFGGYGEVPKTVTVGIGVFAVVSINSLGAVRNIETVLMEAGRNFGANWWNMFRHVVLPGSLPTIFTGLRLGAATGLLVVIAAEFTYTETGLGYLIWQSWNTLSTTRMFVGLIMIAVLGVVITLLLSLADRLFLPWKVR